MGYLSLPVANDVPVEESLRKTYVGSDQFGAGQMVARQLIKEMGTTGEVIILGDQETSILSKRTFSWNSGCTWVTIQTLE